MTETTLNLDAIVPAFHPVECGCERQHCPSCLDAADELALVGKCKPVSFGPGALELLLSRVLGSPAAPSTLGVTFHALPLPLVDWVQAELDNGAALVDARRVLEFLGYRYDEGRARGATRNGRKL